ncbi:MAG TPA: Na/Pi cotransporter family protein, partial [Acidiphilium sp.]
VALGAAAREALRLADELKTMLAGLRAALEKDDRRRVAETGTLDDVMDVVSASIGTYLSALDPAAMTEADHRRAGEIMAFVTGLESAGDVVERNLLALAAKRIKRGLGGPRETTADLLDAIDRLLANLHAAAALFVCEDVRAARRLAAEKLVFRGIEAKAAAERFGLLRAGGMAAAETTALHLDILRDLKRVNAHLIEASAYPVLESKGELLSSRLIRVDEPPELARDAA